MPALYTIFDFANKQNVTLDKRSNGPRKEIGSCCSKPCMTALTVPMQVTASMCMIGAARSSVEGYAVCMLKTTTVGT